MKLDIFFAHTPFSYFEKEQFVTTLLWIDWIVKIDLVLKKPDLIFYSNCCQFFFVGFWVEKQNLQQRETRGIFPVGFATAHLEVIREPGRPVSQAGALLAGQDELGEGGSIWSLSVFHVFLSLCPSLSISLSHAYTHTSPWQNPKITTRRQQQVYRGDRRWTASWTGTEEKRTKSCLSFHLLIWLSIYLFISLSGSCLPGESEGLCLWCVCRFVYVFKVGRVCLTRTMGHKDLGEDRRLLLYVYTFRREWIG